MMRLTTEMVDALRTNGSFTHATIRALQMDPKTLKPGWAKDLVGKPIAETVYQKALDGVGVFRPYTLRRKERQEKATPVLSAPSVTISSSDFNELVMEVQRLREEVQRLTDRLKALEVFVMK